MAKKQPIKFLGIKTTKKGKKIFIMALILLGLILFDLFTPFGGNIRFYSTWISCGQKPVRERMGIWRSVESYEISPAFGAFFGNLTEYYCTPIEAERAGLSADVNVWDFPHLREAGENHPYTKKPFLNRQ